jgi:hypothetical protein
MMGTQMDLRLVQQTAHQKEDVKVLQKVSYWAKTMGFRMVLLMAHYLGMQKGKKMDYLMESC